MNRPKNIVNRELKMDLNEVLESERPAEYLYHYALSNGRLKPEWERLFLEFRDIYYIISYAEYAIQERWPEAEPILLESKNAHELYWYARLVIEGRWPEAEPILLESKDAHELCWYAKWVIEGRWPEAEPIIKQDKVWWKDYCKHFNIKEEDGLK